MRLLLFGGSWFLGRLLVKDFVDRGFDVTVFNSKAAGNTRGYHHVRGSRKREQHLQSLAKLGPWDVVVDVSGKVPSIVQRAARVLASVTQRYVSISTIGVYRDWPHASVDEDSALSPGDPNHDPGTRVVDPRTYGVMKVGCEMACRDAFGDDRLLILRLHHMIGRYEYAGPLRWWLERMRRGGQVLVPSPDRPLQSIDVRDVARFVAERVASGANGVLNVATQARNRTFGSMIRACEETTSADVNLVRTDEEWLLARGVKPWTELPLWQHGSAAEISTGRATAAGLQCRPLSSTIADLWAWMNSSDHKANSRDLTFGIEGDRESALIARWLDEISG